MIRFQHQAIRVAQMHFHQCRHVAQIRDQCQLHTIGAKRKSDGVRRIMRNGKSMHFNIADAKSLPGLDLFHSAQPLAQCFRQRALQRVHGRPGHIQRRLPQAQHLRQAVAMIVMFVSD